MSHDNVLESGSLCHCYVRLCPIVLISSKGSSAENVNKAKGYRSDPNPCFEKMIDDKDILEHLILTQRRDNHFIRVFH